MANLPIYTCALKPQSCNVCPATSPLLGCGGCKITTYCSASHQSSDWSSHKSLCNTIMKNRQRLEQEEAALRDMPDDYFNNCAGRFWGLIETREYMRARFQHANGLLDADTRFAVDIALIHFMDMLRLCRSDNLGVRDAVPPLMLRLGREQECYDFLKWWATANRNGRYDWGDLTLPHLNIRGADAFEPIEPFFLDEGCLSLSQLACLTLLKLRLYMDLDAYNTSLEDMFSFGGPVRRAMGALVKEKVKSVHPGRIAVLTGDLRKQYLRLCEVVHDANAHFWEALVDDERHSPPSAYSMGSPEEAHLAIHQCKTA